MTHSRYCDWRDTGRWPICLSASLQTQEWGRASRAHASTLSEHLTHSIRRWHPPPPVLTGSEGNQHGRRQRADCSPRTARRRGRSRRGKGEGSIYARKTGGYCAQIVTGHRADGKPVRKHFYGRTREEVQKKLLAHQTDSINGLSLETPRMTLSVWLARWLNDSVKPRLRAATYDSYERAVRLHIGPHRGCAVKAHSHTGRGVLRSVASGRRERSLDTACSHRPARRPQTGDAARARHAKRVQPGRSSAIPPAPHRSTHQGANRGLTACSAGNGLRALYFVAIFTGLRQGEILGLQWADLDLDARTLSVRRTLHELKNGTVECGDPKTPMSRRRVDLAEPAVAALRRHREEMMAEGHRAVKWVFCDTQGQPLRKSNFIRRSFHPLRKASGVPGDRALP